MIILATYLTHNENLLLVELSANLWRDFFRVNGDNLCFHYCLFQILLSTCGTTFLLASVVTIRLISVHAPLGAKD